MNKDYFLDFEFMEGSYKPFLGKKRHYIDMISIGIAAADGRTYYAISNQFNPADANEWVRTNIFPKLVAEWVQKYPEDQREAVIEKVSRKTLDEAIRMMQKEIGKSEADIAQEIIRFCNGTTNIFVEGDKISFFGYFSDYDWVLFCSLFGTMMDLPSNFPMFCIDLKQTLDEVSLTAAPFVIKNNRGVIEHVKPSTQGLKKHPNYPVNSNEHNALEDAIWNMKLRQFLKSLKQ